MSALLILRHAGARARVALCTRAYFTRYAAMLRAAMPIRRVPPMPCRHDKRVAQDVCRFAAPDVAAAARLCLFRHAHDITLYAAYADLWRYADAAEACYVTCRAFAARCAAPPLRA